MGATTGSLVLGDIPSPPSKPLTINEHTKFRLMRRGYWNFYYYWEGVKRFKNIPSYMCLPRQGETGAAALTSHNGIFNRH